MLLHLGYRKIKLIYLSLICTVGIFVLLSSSMTSVYGPWSSESFCPTEMKDMLLNQKIMLSSTHYLNTKFEKRLLECFEINENEAGISQFMMERNFRHMLCPNISKRFLNAYETFPKVAIASIPGSGNAWTRHLIEELTGIYTGTIYKEGPQSMLFPGDNATDRVIAIKTHETVQDAKKMDFDHVILIVRDPFDTHIAEFNRKYTNLKTGILKREEFNFEIFKELLPIRINEWLAFNQDWMKKFRGEIFVLFYERLQSDFYNSVAKLGHFLRKRVTLKDVWCIGRRREGLYHRKPKPEWMSRWHFVNPDLQNDIAKGKVRLYDLCMALRSRIQTNV